MTGNTGICWRWNGPYSLTNADYGEFRGHGAHRVAYFLDTDNQPGRLSVCHTCDHPWCVNPTHLFLGTAKDNAADREAKGRHAHAGREGPREKIDEAAVRDIRTSNESIPTLMQRYGITESWAHKIRSRKAWKHVT